MFRVAICDDEPQEAAYIAGLMRDILAERGAEFAVDVFVSPTELERACIVGGTHYDLLLLDILMEAKNGVELARLLRETGEQMQLVFITSSPDFAINSYKVGARDYLLKPIKRQDLQETFDRVFAREETLMVESKTMTQIIPIARIRYLETQDHTLLLVTVNSSISIRGTLNEIVQRLPAKRFVRCHRSFLINLTYVKSLAAGRVILTDGTELPIGRQYSTALQEAFLHFAKESILLRS